MTVFVPTRTLRITLTCVHLLARTAALIAALLVSWLFQPTDTPSANKQQHPTAYPPPAPSPLACNLYTSCCARPCSRSH